MAGEFEAFDPGRIGNGSLQFLAQVGAALGAPGAQIEVGRQQLDQPFIDRFPE